MIQIKLNPHKYDRYIATIGNFDGLHQGHFSLLSKMSQYAKTHNLGRLLITFEPLTHEFIALNNATPVKPRLSLLRDRVKYLSLHDLVDEVLIIRFNQNISQLSPAQFISKITDKFSLDSVMLGLDFRFGHKASGDVRDFTANGIKAINCEDYIVDNCKISSTIIRDLLADNQLTQAYVLLGHSISYTSRVVRGNQLGRKYGVPTINLSLGFRSPALWGIYCAYVYIDGRRYNAVASVGKNPTVSITNTYKLEAHLLDVDADLYGKIATIEFLEFLRPELKFDSLDKLFEQIADDLLNTRNFFAEKI